MAANKLTTQAKGAKGAKRKSSPVGASPPGLPRSAHGNDPVRIIAEQDAELARVLAEIDTKLDDIEKRTRRLSARIL